MMLLQSILSDKVIYICSLPNQVAIANVTFEPGCRNHWHIHRAKSGGGQILLVTAGHGYYQEWGEKARELHPGDVVNIPGQCKTLARRCT